jgi:outer membrane lipoprotein-sorting protein
MIHLKNILILLLVVCSLLTLSGCGYEFSQETLDSLEQMKNDYISEKEKQIIEFNKKYNSYEIIAIDTDIVVKAEESPYVVYIVMAIDNEGELYTHMLRDDKITIIETGKAYLGCKHDASFVQMRLFITKDELKTFLYNKNVG